jgi:hypothetical protein
MDLGGELGRCQEVLDLFTQAGYVVEPTAPNSSHQNGPVERPHRDIRNSIRAMLSCVSLAPRFWPYTFYHVFRLHNMTIHGDQVKTPYELCSGRKPDVSRLRNFAVVCTSNLLALADTPSPRSTHVPVFSLATRRPRRTFCAQHARYDECMYDVADPPPNARLVRFAQQGEFLHAEAALLEPLDLDVSENPF